MSQENISSKIILITGCSSGFGRLTAEALARQGHCVYAGIRDPDRRNSAAAGELRELLQVLGLADLDPVPQDADQVASQGESL